MTDNEQACIGAMAERHEAPLALGVIRVRVADRESIVEDRDRLVKRNAMFGEIFDCLLVVPVEIHLLSP